MTKHKTSDNSAAYKLLAKYYDVMMADGKYPGWKDVISSVVKHYGIERGVCLDVACGTGNISKLLKELDFRIVGVDMSEDMISVAKKKFPQDVFITSDVRNFSLSDKVKSEITFAVSFYDSLNYLLSDKDMLKALQGVYNNIPSDTIFLFDMNTTQHVQAAQKYKPRVLENSDFYSVYRFSGEGRFWILDMDIFMKEGDKYRLVKERHIERAYDEEHIVPLVRQAGFDLLDVKKEYKLYDGVKLLSRLYFIVRKP